MTTTVQKKGQITLPKTLRDQLGLRPGTKLRLFVEDGKVVGEKTQEEDPLQRWVGRGVFPVPRKNTKDRPTTAEYMKLVRPEANL